MRYRDGQVQEGLSSSGTSVSPRAESVASLVRERIIPLKGVAGRIDHLAVDLGRSRLFVAELGNGTVDVIDLSTGAVVRRIDRLSEPQGVGYGSSAGHGSVHLFRGADLTPLDAVDLGDGARQRAARCGP